MGKLDDRIRYVTGEPPKQNHTGCWLSFAGVVMLIVILVLLFLHLGGAL